jgi:hypothetical protein
MGCGVSIVIKEIMTRRRRRRRRRRVGEFCTGVGIFSAFD